MLNGKAKRNKGWAGKLDVAAELPDLPFMIVRMEHRRSHTDASCLVSLVVHHPSLKKCEGFPFTFRDYHS